ncbi:MAG: TetR/AcrR family transcriptional regulator [Telmatospirillum sp.]|nr:TetR/AcrR family transcriptional regulator [Telmatospirillum sp.]
MRDTENTATAETDKHQAGPAKRGRRPKRSEVLDAAVEEILEKGYAAATLAMIAERANVSTATVFKHFRTKAEIFGAIMRRVWGNEEESLPPELEPGNPRAGLTAIGHDYAATVTDPKIRALFRVMIAEVPRFPELGQELYEKGKRPYLDRLRTYLEAEVAAGTLAIADLDLAVRQFLGMINDVIFWPHMLVVDLAETTADIDRVVDGAVETMIRAHAR